MVPVKFDIDGYQLMSTKAIESGMNRSEYIRHSSTHCKVVKRLTVRDLKAIRDLQGIAQNLNTIAKAYSAMMKGSSAMTQAKIQSIVEELAKCRAFVLSLINTYRRSPEDV